MEAQQGAELPDREEMYLINATFSAPFNAPIAVNVLTDLLYHVVEQIDGQRNLDEIAARMSEAIDRDVTADNVRQLIGSKLIPLGIVVGADGSVVGADAAGEGIARSPLKINMKTKVL